MTTGASIVLILEIVTDKALSPFARKVITFDVVPVGEQPNRIRPTASMGDKPNSLPKPIPTKGIHIYTVRIPIITSLGRNIISLKSCGVIESPMPSIIKLRQGEITTL